MTTQELVAAIVAERERRLADTIRAYPQAMTRASNIPVCARQGVYTLTRNTERKLHDTRLAARFEAGNVQEAWAVGELMKLGHALDFKIVESQVPLERGMTERYKLTGHIDGKIEFGKGAERRRVPFDVKSMHPLFYDKVNTVEDILEDAFLRRYYRQLQIYMLGHNETEGILVLTDCLGHWKFIIVPLDYDAAETILQTVEEVNRHVAAGTLPDRIPYDPDECGNCPFAHICLPDVIEQARAVFADDAELAEAVARHEHLKPLADEYEQLHDKIKESVKDKPLVVVGDFIIEGKASTMTLTKVPDSEKAKYQVKIPTWRFKIKRHGDVDTAPTME